MGIVWENSILEIKFPYKGRDRKIVVDEFFFHF